MTEQQKKMGKLCMYLLQRYGEELYAEFGINKNDTLSQMLLIDKIVDKMDEEIPNEWYLHCFGG